MRSMVKGTRPAPSHPFRQRRALRLSQWSLQLKQTRRLVAAARHFDSINGDLVQAATSVSSYPQFETIVSL